MSVPPDRVWRQRLALLRLLREVPWRWRAALWSLLAVACVLPAAFAVAVGALVARVPAAVEDGVGSSAGDRLWWALVGIAALLLVERLTSPLLDIVRYRVGRDIDGAIRRDLLLAVENDPLISRLESAEVQSQLALVKGGLFGTAGTAAVASAGVVGRYAQTLFAFAIVAWFSPWLAAATGVVILAIRRRWHMAFSTLAEGILESAEELRKVTYTAELVTTPPAAKEVRVFDLVDWLRERSRGYWHEAVAAPFAVRARLRRAANIELSLLGLSYALTFVVAARAAADGEIGLALLAAILQAQFSAAQLIAPTSDDFSTGPGTAARRAAGEVQRHLAPPPKAKRAPAVADRPRESIVFDGVTFAYPGSSRAVLDGLDLEVAAGEAFALVGLNGAGKTTLVKLLCGLYVPNGGRILIDDVPLEDFDPEEWRTRLAVIFQDFVRYELSARDNVRAVDLGGDVLVGQLDRAAAAAGATDIISGLPAGWETVLSRQYAGGVDLSGGQWQRIALARALFAVQAGAGLLILDEPTANLDVRAEAELFDRFLDWTAETTSLLISHRFSTVRRAGRIAVLADGRISETGTHDELLCAGGRYAEMFRLQAQRFQDTNAESVDG